MNLEVPIVQQRLGERKPNETCSSCNSDGFDSRHDRVEHSKLKDAKGLDEVFEFLKVAFYILADKQSTSLHASLVVFDSTVSTLLVNSGICASVAFYRHVRSQVGRRRPKCQLVYARICGGAP